MNHQQRIAAFKDGWHSTPTEGERVAAGLAAVDKYDADRLTSAGLASNFRRGGTFARVPMVAGQPDHHAEGAAALLADRNRIARECADVRDENADLYAKLELLEGRLAAQEIDSAHKLGVIRDYFKAHDARIVNVSVDTVQDLADARHNLRRLIEVTEDDDYEVGA